MAGLLIHLTVRVVRIIGIHICIMTEAERVDDAIIGSWHSVSRHALPDQKNLFGEALNIVMVFHQCGTSNVTLQKGLREFLLAHVLFAHFLCSWLLKFLSQYV